MGRLRGRTGTRTPPAERCARCPHRPMAVPVLLLVIGLAAAPPARAADLSVGVLTCGGDAFPWLPALLATLPQPTPTPAPTTAIPGLNSTAAPPGGGGSAVVVLQQTFPAGGNANAVLQAFVDAGAQVLLLGCEDATDPAPPTSLVSAAAFRGVVGLALTERWVPVVRQEPLALGFSPNSRSRGQAMVAVAAHYGWRRAHLFVDASPAGSQLAGNVVREAGERVEFTVAAGATEARLASGLDFVEANKLNIVFACFEDPAATTALLALAAARGLLATGGRRVFLVCGPPTPTPTPATPADDSTPGVLFLDPLEAPLSSPTEAAAARAIDALARAAALAPAAVASPALLAEALRGLAGHDGEGLASTSIPYRLALPDATPVADIVSGNGTVVPVASPAPAATAALQQLGEVFDAPKRLVVAFAILRSSGVLGAISQERELAARTVVELLNLEYGLDMDLIIYDVGTTEACEAAGHALVALGVAAVVGAGSSECSIAMHPPLRDAGVPHVGYSETSPELSDKARFPLFFRTSPSDTNQALALSDLCLRYMWASVGVVATDDAYGAGLANAFEAEFIAARLEFFAAGAGLPEVEAAVSRVLDEGSAVQLVSASARDAENVLLAASRLGVTGPGWTWIGTDASAGLTLDPQLAADLQGMVGLQPRSGDGPVWEALLAFDSLDTQFDVLARTANSQLRYVPQLHDAFAAVAASFHRSLTGRRLLPPESGVCAEAANATAAALGLAPPAARGSTASLSTAEQRQMILQGLLGMASPEAGFPGSTGGCVWFDARQDGPVAYDVVNLRANAEWANIGRYTLAGLDLRENPIWSDGTAVVPSDAQPEGSGASGLRVALLVGLLVGLCVLAALLGLYVRRQFVAMKQAAARRCSYLPLPDEWEVPPKDVQLNERIGSGAFGVVYRGTMRTRRRARDVVGVKLMREESDHSEKLHFIDEAVVMKNLSETPHPNVVQLRGVCMQDEPLMILLEFCDLGDLRHYLQDQKGLNSGPNLSFRDMVFLALQAARGMCYLHRQGVVHRDLSARNCLLNTGEDPRDMVLKVSDFGASKALSEKGMDYYRQTGTAFLPARWLPPEVFTEGRFTYETDRWSFGILYWEIVTWAQLPYPSMNNKEVIQSVIEGFRMERPEGCPRSIFDIMSRCWATAPEARPAFPVIAKELHRIVRLLDGVVKPDVAELGRYSSLISQHSQHSTHHLPRHTSSTSADFDEWTPLPPADSDGPFAKSISLHAACQLDNLLPKGKRHSKAAAAASASASSSYCEGAYVGVVHASPHANGNGNGTGGSSARSPVSLSLDDSPNGGYQHVLPETFETAHEVQTAQSWI